MIYFRKFNLQKITFITDVVALMAVVGMARPLRGLVGRVGERLVVARGVEEARRECSKLAFVPEHRETQELDVQRLQEFIEPSRRLLVLTGAGARVPKFPV